MLYMVIHMQTGLIYLKKTNANSESIQNINQTLDGLHLQLFTITFCYI